MPIRSATSAAPCTWPNTPGAARCAPPARACPAPWCRTWSRGLDVLSPYEDGSCSDEDFENLLRLMETPEFREGYDCLIVDSPPFLGTKPAQLVAACDEYVLVMRAEANAYLTLPAFQELIQRSKRNGKAPQMRGILLTLAEGEEPDSHWERELRGRYGTRILPQAIPFDAEAAQARDAGAILQRTAPDGPAAVQYAGLVESLGLTGNGRRPTAESPVLRAAAAFEVQPAAASADTVRLTESTTGTVEVKPASAPASPDTPPPELPEEPDLPTDVGAMHTMPRIPVLRFLPPSGGKPAAPVGPSAHRQAANGQPALNGHASPKLAASRSSPALAKLNSKGKDDNLSLFVWIGVAMVMGFGLHFIHIPQRLVPLVVSGAVTAGTLLLLRLLLPPSSPTAAAIRPATRASGPRPRPQPQPQSETKPVPPRPPEPKKELTDRLASLTRRTGARRSTRWLKLSATAPAPLAGVQPRFVTRLCDQQDSYCELPISSSCRAMPRRRPQRPDAGHRHSDHPAASVPWTPRGAGFGPATSPSACRFSSGETRNSTSGMMPQSSVALLSGKRCRFLPLGRKNVPVVRRSCTAARPRPSSTTGLMGKSRCTLALPRVRWPTITARLWSCSAAATSSAPPEVSPLTSTASGRSSSLLGPPPRRSSSGSLRDLIVATGTAPRNNRATSTESSR